MALASFYENDGDNAPSPVNVPSEVRNDTVDDVPGLEPPPRMVKTKHKSGKNSKFMTVHTLSSSSEDEDEGQAFYAGGSEHSGQQVLGPSKKKDFVADMFKSVKE